MPPRRTSRTTPARRLALSASLGTVLAASFAVVPPAVADAVDLITVSGVFVHAEASVGGGSGDPRCNNTGGSDGQQSAVIDATVTGSQSGAYSRTAEGRNDTGSASATASTEVSMTDLGDQVRFDAELTLSATAQSALGQFTGGGNGSLCDIRAEAEGVVIFSLELDTTMRATLTEAGGGSIIGISARDSQGRFQSFLSVADGTESTVLAPNSYDVVFASSGAGAGAGSTQGSQESAERTATSSLVLSSSNAPPVAEDDDIEVVPGGSVAVDVLANDTDPDGDDLTVTDAQGAEFGTATCGAASCTYTADADVADDPEFAGVDSFFYTVDDGNGATATGLVRVTFTVNRDPEALDDEAEVRAGESVVIDVLANDSDPDDDPLVITSSGGPPQFGSVACTPSECTYTADTDVAERAGFDGTDFFTYEISDGQDGTATGIVSVAIDANRRPVTVDDAVSAETVNGTLFLDVLANDSDPDDDALEIVDHTGSLFGQAECGPADCTYTFDRATFADDPDFAGVDSFRYTVSDGRGATTVGLAFIHFDNTAPDAVGDSAQVRAGESVTVDVLANDTDADGDPLAITAHNDPLHGTVACSEASCTYTADADAGRQPGFAGSDSFGYTVGDGKGLTDSAAVVVTIDANRDPDVVDDAATVATGGFARIDVLANDSDPDGDDLTVTGAEGAAFGTVTCDAQVCRYEPALDVADRPGFGGADIFNYTVSDGNGGTGVGIVTVTIDANRPPVALDDRVEVGPGQPASVDVLANDSDPDGDPLSITAVVDAPLFGTASCAASTCTYVPGADHPGGVDFFVYGITDGRGGNATATVTIDAFNVDPIAVTDQGEVRGVGDAVTVDVLANDSDPDGDPLTITSHTQGEFGSVTCARTCTYTSTARPDGVAGDADFFDYTIGDGKGGSATTTVVILFSNEAPTPLDDSASAVVGVPAVIDVLANDSDPDGDPLTVTAATTPGTGTVTCSSDTCTYLASSRPPGGTDSFTYVVSDGRGNTASAAVTVAVTDSAALTATDDAVTTPFETPIEIDVLANDLASTLGGSLTVASVTSPAHGTVTCATTCSYTPDAGFSGIDSFVYTLSDGILTDTATVSVDVEAALFTVSGTVTGPTGAPLPGIQVSANGLVVPRISARTAPPDLHAPSAAARASAVVSTLTDADGDFTLLLPAGQHRLTFLDPTGRHALPERRITVGEDGSDLDPIDVGAKVATVVRARIVDPALRSGQRARVKARVARADGRVIRATIAVLSGSRIVGTARLRAADAGRARVRLRRLPPGRHTLRVVVRPTASTARSSSEELQVHVTRR